VKKNTSSDVSRRRFLKATAAGTALAAGALPVPSIAQSGPKEFKIGLIGCGGRGTGAANDARNAGKITGDTVKIHAVADLFEDKVVPARKSFGVEDKNAFFGFDAFKKLLEVGCDYVILATPPHFRAEHFEAAINAGKHVFTEKPVAVDPFGYRRFIAAGDMAKAKGLSVAAGTQRRHEKQYMETQKRVADGAIGDVVAGRCYWNQGGLWSREKEEGWSDTEWQIRNWLYFTWLSGDHIVEQHVHNLDVLNWFLGAHPVRARGMGGRQVRTAQPKYGNIFDHFATELIYPKGVRVTSMCRQIDGCWGDVSEFVVGTKGGTNCRNEIYGPSAWKFSGDQVDPYVQEHIDLQASIKEGKGSLNETKNVATSTMTAILARTACYTGKEIAWDDLVQSNERLGPEKYEFGPMAIPAIARPGNAM
jgi:predicted dehydrogenase